MAWSDYSTAPDPGTPVAALADVTGALTLTISSDRGDFPLLLVRSGDDVHGYVNACPHQYLPLD